MHMPVFMHSKTSSLLTAATRVRWPTPDLVRGRGRGRVGVGLGLGLGFGLG